MSSPAVAFSTEVHKKFATYWPAWLPTTAVTVGDCGVLTRGIFFEPRRLAASFGVSKAALKTKRVTRDAALDFASEKGVGVQLQAHGQNVIPGIPAGRAGGQITFSRANASFLAAIGVRERAVADKYMLEQELRGLVQQGTLPPEYVVVTDVVTASSGRVFISSAPGQSVTLHAAAHANAGPLQVASLGGQLSLASSTGTMMAFDGTQGMTPLFKLMGFSVGGWIRRARRRLLSQNRHLPRIVVKSIDAKPQVGTEIMVRPIEGQQIAIAPVGRKPFVVEPTELKPFMVEPTLVDRGTLGAILPERPPAGDPQAAHRRLPEGVLLGSIEADPAVGGEVVVQLFEDSALVIEPVDGDPFLVKLAERQSLEFEPTVLDFPETLELVTHRTPTIEDPFTFGYVDFDAELAGAYDADMVDSGELTVA